MSGTSVVRPIRTRRRVLPIAAFAAALMVVLSGFAATAGAVATTTTKKSTTTTSPSKTTTTKAPTTSTTARASTTTTASAALLPGSTSTSGPKATSSGGLSAETQLRLVVGGLILVGGLVGFLTVLYWRRTSPPKISSALDALADLDTTPASGRPLVGSNMIGAAAAGARAPGAAPAVAGAGVAGETAAVATMAGAAGSGVRILGPVVEPKSNPATGPATRAQPPVTAEAASVVDPVEAPTEALSATTPPLVEPEPLLIVTVEDLQRRAEAAATADPEPAPTPVNAPDETGDGYGDSHE